MRCIDSPIDSIVPIKLFNVNKYFNYFGNRVTLSYLAGAGALFYEALYLMRYGAMVLRCYDVTRCYDATVLQRCNGALR